MTAPRPAPRPVLRALVVLAVVLAALRLVPPFTYALLAPVVVAGEASPLVALFAVVLAVVAAIGRRRRIGLAVAALLAAAVASVPWLEARRAARAGEAAIAALPVPPVRPPLVAPAADTAAAAPRAADRVLHYAAADGTPLVGWLYRSAGPGLRPAFVVFYGGAWRGGNAGQSAPLDRGLAAAGWAVIALDYRHAPASRYPSQLDDTRLGLRLVRDSARAWGVDPARLVLWGRSSGAHLALLTAWTDSVPDVPPLRGVVDYYGPVDLPEGYAHPPRPDPIDARAVLRDFLGGTPAQVGARYRDASPLDHVRAGLPPTLLVYGGHDHLVEPRFGRALARALVAVGDPAVYVELPWAEHGFDAVPGGVGGRVANALALQFAARVTGDSGSPPGVTQP